MIKDLDYTPIGLSDYPTRVGGQLSPHNWQKEVVDSERRG